MQKNPTYSLKVIVLVKCELDVFTDALCHYSVSVHFRFNQGNETVKHVIKSVINDVVLPILIMFRLQQSEKNAFDYNM